MTDFDTLIDRKNTGSIKWDSNVTLFKNPDVIPMWVADMDFQSPPQIVEALQQKAQHGLFGYTEASERYLEHVVNWMQRRNHWPIQASWILHCPTVVTSLYLTVQAFTDPHDKILIQTPVYPPFHACVLDNDRELVFTPLVIIADQALRNRFKTILKKTHAWAPNIFGLTAAEAAYAHGKPWLEELITYLEANRDLLVDFIARKIPPLRLIKPEGTYLAWLDGRELGLGENLNAFFADKANVGFSDGKVFGEDGLGFQRINFACPRSRLLQALRNMEKAVTSR